MKKISVLLLIFSVFIFHNELSFAAKYRSQNRISVQKKKNRIHDQKQTRTKSRQPKSAGYSKAAQYLQNNEPQALIEE